MTSVTDKLPVAVGRPLNLILKVMRLIVTVSGFVMAGTFLFVVLVRNFGGNLFAFEEWLMAISFWGFFMGAVLASERRMHINADILSVIITNPHLAWWRQLVVQIIEFVVTMIISYWAYLMVRDEILSYPIWQTTAALKIPFLFWRTGIFLSFIFMSVFAAAHLYVHIVDRNAPASGRAEVTS
ncbi:TRAP transporter small permease [Roseibium sp. SCP14]|uniref:TRAP transporter small permease n=1 Tax=Roseibium sp. SCP14 TaxID=3141375 RepID=UPI0033398BC1